MIVLNKVGGLEKNFLIEFFLPTVYNDMEMDKIGQHPWTILGLICDWLDCCCADLLT